MRNCFVPQCDAYCKKNGILKRMMFSAPKDNFEKWKNKLFNKREFRETDRVCERHFEKDQILTHWDHIIDGKLCQLEREKPKIKADAEPSLNLPETETTITANNKKRDVKHKPETRKRKQYTVSSKHKEKVVKEEQYEDNDTIPAFEVDNCEIVHLDEPKPIGRARVKVQNRLDDDAKRQIFDTVYDDIYEVVLPTTLWGTHRDEYRQYIAFTMFDPIAMNCLIAVKITDTFNLYVHVNGVQQTNEELYELNVEALTKLLNELNDTSEHEKVPKCP